MAELSRTERRKTERQARKDAQQKQNQKKKIASRLQTAVLCLIGALLLAGAGYWAYAKWNAGSPAQFVKSLGNRHISESEVGLINYNSDPPTSGPHLPMIANWGIHQQPVTKELQVHNLEDGGVIVQYNCPLTNPECVPLIEKLAGIVRRYSRNVILAPYPDMKEKIALTAWSRIDKFDDFDENRIVRFIEAYIHIDHHPPGGG
ncbi:MAG TPA: DUF3105 domain-containing protein [Candidatus Binatia bacterium]|jgi:hypothetical protein